MRISRALLSLLAVFSILVTMAIPVAAEDLTAADLPRVAVLVDGVPLNADAYVINGRTVVPLRALFNALGATVEWDDATRTVTGIKGNRIIKLTIDQTVAYVDGKPVTLAVPALLINARTFVPLRFVGEALDAAVSFDSATNTVIIETTGACKLAGGQKHTGTIKPGGETWGLCGSPHIVGGSFTVAGADNPVLTIEAGVLVQFEAHARIDVGNGTIPGGLVVKGTAEKPVRMTSALSAAKPGDWDGIHFTDQTLQNAASIENALIEYAGGSTQYSGAVHATTAKGDLPVTLKNVTIQNSLGAGLRLMGGARLTGESGNITITGTAAAGQMWGYPVVTDVAGLGSLPASMTLTGNALNAIDIYSGSSIDIDRDTTIRNLKVPYVAALSSFEVGGVQNPTLTIELGVIMLFPKGGSIVVGRNAPGRIVADATAGASEAWNGNYKSLLDQGALLADGKSIMTGNAAWATNQAIVFGTTEPNPAKGSWVGIQFQRNAGTGSKLAGVVVNWAGGVRDDTAAVLMDGDTVQIGMDKSMVMNSAQNGMRMWNNARFSSFSGNYLTGTVSPLKLFANAVGSIGTGNDLTGNQNEWIDVIGGNVTESQTWQEGGAPIHLSQSVTVIGSANPVLTLGAGTKLIAAMDKGLRVGDGATGTGSLVAVGTAEKPITFTSELERPGTWEGITFGTRAGKENKIENARIAYAKTGITLRADLGAFLKNLTIANSSAVGIVRGYPSTGTDFTKEATIKFESNPTNQR